MGKIIISACKLRGRISIWKPWRRRCAVYHASSRCCPSRPPIRKLSKYLTWSCVERSIAVTVYNICDINVHSQLLACMNCWWEIIVEQQSRRLINSHNVADKRRAGSATSCAVISRKTVTAGLHWHRRPTHRRKLLQASFKSYQRIQNSTFIFTRYNLLASLQAGPHSSNVNWQLLQATDAGGVTDLLYTQSCWIITINHRKIYFTNFEPLTQFYCNNLLAVFVFVYLLTPDCKKGFSASCCQLMTNPSMYAAKKLLFTKRCFIDNSLIKWNWYIISNWTHCCLTSIPMTQATVTHRCSSYVENAHECQTKWPIKAATVTKSVQFFNQNL